MNRRIPPLAQFALAAIGFAMASLAGVAAEVQGDPPPWIAQVPVLRSGDAQSFRFRARIDLIGIHLVAYVSWAPPDHRSVILCDGSDGLPLVISIDGQAWIYDLVSGQILRSKDEPDFDISAQDRSLNFKFGTNASGQSGGIHVDFASIFGRESGDIRATEDGQSRVATLSSGKSQSEIKLRVTPSNPPLPVSVLIVVSSMNPPGRVEFDAFRFGAPLPRWQHALDPEALAQDVPFSDMDNMQDMPQEKQKQVEAFKQLMLSGGSFLIRPAIHDPAAREKLAQLPVKINFEQMALHEKLLSKAWLRALARQGSDPAKFAAEMLAADETRKDAHAGAEAPPHAQGLNPAVVVVDMERLFTAHPETEKVQRELTARVTAEEDALSGEMETAKKLVAEAAALDKKLARPDLTDAERKALLNSREEIAAKVGRTNQRVAATNEATAKWKAARADEIIQKIESSLHGLSNGSEAVVVLNKNASTPNKVPAVVFSSAAMEISDQAMEAIRAGKAISPEVIKNAPRKLRMAAVDLYQVFNRLNETKKVSDQLEEVTRSSNAEIKERTDSLKALRDETDRLAREAQETGLDDSQREERKKVLKEKALLLQQGDEDLKSLEAARDKRFAEINQSGLMRIPREIQRAVMELARTAGADLVLDSTGQSTSSTSMVFRLQGVPDWTEAVIAKMNLTAPETKTPGDATLNQTVSSERLRFGTLNFQKVLAGVPAGEAFKQKDAEANAKLKELAAKGDNSGEAKEAILAEGRALLGSIVGAADRAIATENGEPDYNVIFETGGKSDNGAPLAVSYDNVPDLTQGVIKALTDKGQ